MSLRLYFIQNQIWIIVFAVRQFSEAVAPLEILRGSPVFTPTLANSQSRSLYTERMRIIQPSSRHYFI